jgi:tRNA (cytidine/uridine-2'-O-)-methyltransferase
MLDVVLYRPEIPPNAGNVIRLCANTGATLHLVEPLGFSMDDRQLRRAGLDYHELASVHVHRDWTGCVNALGSRRLLAFTTRGEVRFDRIQYREDDVLVFGPETAGFDEAMLALFPRERRVRLPMIPGNRSLNLSNAVAVAVFEAWRQSAFRGGA